MFWVFVVVFVFVSRSLGKGEGLTPVHEETKPYLLYSDHIILKNAYILRLITEVKIDMLVSLCLI